MKKENFFEGLSGHSRHSMTVCKKNPRKGSLLNRECCNGEGLSFWLELRFSFSSSSDLNFLGVIFSRDCLFLFNGSFEGIFE